MGAPGPRISDRRRHPHPAAALAFALALTLALALTPEICAKFTGADNLLNECAMMWALRERFPLHLLVCKQAAAHIPHEANVEQFFSRAGNLADPNQKPHPLATPSPHS